VLKTRRKDIYEETKNFSNKKTAGRIKPKTIRKKKSEEYWKPLQEQWQKR